MRVLNAENRAVATDGRGDPRIEAMVLRRQRGEWDYEVRSFGRVVVVRGPVQHLRVGAFEVSLPLDAWIVAGDRDVGEIDVIRAEEAARRFEVVVLNPLTSPVVRFEHMVPVGLEPDGVFVLPAVERDVFVVVPLCTGSNPPCLLVAPEPPRQNLSIAISDLL